MAVLVLALELACCLGLGAAALHLLRVLPDLRWDERLSWSFAIGFGLLGWVLFFFGAAGLFSGAALLALLIIGALGMVFLRAGPTWQLGRPELPDWVLILAFAVVFTFDLLEGLSPPSDADSLAYHFALPRQFLEAGALVFQPRALDGAIPLLTQMTYVPALGLGGERALTLWTMISGWAVGFLLYSYCRRYMDGRIAGLVVLVFLSTPAVLYVGGSGQVETRNALFVMMAVVAVSENFRTGLLRYALLAGLAAGFFVGAKYLGLLFAFACGLGLLIRGSRITQGAVFSLAMLAAGFQWYLWNWLHTGDPVFPLLVGNYGIGNVALWPQEFQAYFVENVLRMEQAVSRSLFWFFAYPFKATFAEAPVFESGRTGLGVFLILVLPFALLGIWQNRKTITSSPLLPVALIVLIFYALWFFTVSSQRIRHLLPLYPVLLVLMSYAAIRYADKMHRVRLLIGAFSIVLAIQFGGHLIYSVNFAKHVFSKESRADFLRRNVIGFEIAQWVNQNLKPSDKLFTISRQLIYLIHIPVYYGSQTDDALIDVRPGTNRPGPLYKQLKKQDITHLSFGLGGNLGHTDFSKRVPPPWARLVRKNCLEFVHAQETRSIASRTVSNIVSRKSTLLVYRLAPTCGLN